MDTPYPEKLRIWLDEKSSTLTPDITKIRIRGPPEDGHISSFKRSTVTPNDFIASYDMEGVKDECQTPPAPHP